MPARLKLRTIEPDADRCPAVGAIKAIVTESRLLVVRHLFTGPKGFNELLRASGINSKTLSATLKFLEQNGIVRREVISTAPFSVQYSLTASGLELEPALEGLGKWGKKWLPQFSGKLADTHRVVITQKIPSK
ncbi:MAG: helix-turn-helix domain-containing protein [Candidatus Bathyarchaeia archaeon]|jgi:DNA-binding HxlR family transcriptional regulator